MFTIKCSCFFLPVAMGLIKSTLYVMLLWQAFVHFSHKYKTYFNIHSFMFHICLYLKTQ